MAPQSAEHRALHHLIRQLPAAVMSTADRQRRHLWSGAVTGSLRLLACLLVTSFHFSLNCLDTHGDGGAGCGFPAGEVLRKRCCLRGRGYRFPGWKLCWCTFALKGQAGNETNAIEKSETAETRHRRNIADLAVAFEMRGGGVCDDIMDILLLGDHTIAIVSPHRRETGQSF